MEQAFGAACSICGRGGIRLFRPYQMVCPLYCFRCKPNECWPVAAVFNAEATKSQGTAVYWGLQGCPDALYEQWLALPL